MTIADMFKSSALINGRKVVGAAYKVAAKTEIVGAYVNITFKDGSVWSVLV